MRVPTFGAIAETARTGIWYFSGAFFLKLTVMIGATLRFSGVMGTGSIVVASVIVATTLGFLVLRKASTRQIFAHFLLAATLVPAYYFCLWLLSHMSPWISDVEIPSSGIFLVFANPLHSANLQVIVLAIPYALAPLLVSWLKLTKRTVKI